MTSAQVEQRLKSLEDRVEQLQATLKLAVPSSRWWIEHAGRFKDDPIFEEIVALGREYREAQRNNHSDEGEAD